MFREKVIDGFVKLSSMGPWGNALSRYLGRSAFSALDLSRYILHDDPARVKKLTEMAQGGGRLIVDIITDDRRPFGVKRALINLVRSVENVHLRNEYRRQHGFAPANLVIDFTNRCNLRCYGCYANSYREGDDLPLDTVNRVVEESKTKWGINFFTLSGGEPFMRMDDMIRLARRHNDVSFMVYTNGTLIDEKAVEKLLAVGNIGPCLSVEGYDAETDERRGKGRFRALMRSMRLMREAGLLFGFSATIMHTNYEQLCSEAFIDFCIEQGCIFGWFFTYVPIGRSPDINLLLRPDERIGLTRLLARYRTKKKPIFVGDFWNDGPLTHGCIAAARLYAHIDGRGDIKPCVFTPVAAANINDVYGGAHPDFRCLEDVFLRSPLFRRFRDRQHGIVDYRAPCSIIDHPDLLRELRQVPGVYETRSAPPGLFDGQIADDLDRLSDGWLKTLEKTGYDVYGNGVGPAPLANRALAKTIYEHGGIHFCSGELSNSDENQETA